MVLLHPIQIFYILVTFHILVQEHLSNMAKAFLINLKMLEPVVGFSSFLAAGLIYFWIDLIGIFS